MKGEMSRSLSRVESFLQRMMIDLRSQKDVSEDVWLYGKTGVAKLFHSSEFLNAYDKFCGSQGP